MPKTNITSHSRSIRRIAIDGHFLDDVQTRLHTDGSSKSITSTSAPVERRHVTEDEEGITFRLPALTALHSPVPIGYQINDGHESVDGNITKQQAGYAGRLKHIVLC